MKSPPPQSLFFLAMSLCSLVGVLAAHLGANPLPVMLVMWEIWSLR